MTHSKKPEIKNLLTKVSLEPDSGRLFFKIDKKKIHIASICGWDYLKKINTDDNGKTDFKRVYKLQRELGWFISRAINEKLCKDTPEST